MSTERFYFGIAAGAVCVDTYRHHHDTYRHHDAHHDHLEEIDFVVTFAPGVVFGVANDIGVAGGSLSLSGAGNVVVGDPGGGAVSIHGGSGMSTIVLGNGDDHVALQGAFNTVVLGDGNDVVNVGTATGSAAFHNGEVHVVYQNYFSATFAAPFGVDGLHCVPGSHSNIGFFNSGTGNIGAFNGLGNGDASDGNYNIGVFNGDANGGTDNGNGNIGAFNGNFNGVENASSSDGNDNGNGNVGVLNGNYNGDFNAGFDSGNGNGNGNLGFDNGNLSGNGVAAVALPGGCGGATGQFVGGFDTVVVGNGSDSITAMAGISTIVAGNGNDTFLIGGSYDTIVAGNGKDSVTGVNVDHASIVLGNGGSSVSLTGDGFNFVKTGSGDDVIHLSGVDNWVDAGGAVTFNTIFGGAGEDTFVLAPSGSGIDKIYDFTLSNGDQLDLRSVLAGTNWDGKVGDIGHFLTTQTVAGGTLLECATTPGGPLTEVAELMNVHCSLATLESYHSLIV